MRSADAIPPPYRPRELAYVALGSMEKTRAAQLIAATLMGMAIGHPASACRMRGPLVLEFARKADAVIVGRISDDRLVMDDELHKRMLSQPNLTADQRQQFLKPGAPNMPDYARFEVQVDEVLAGKAPQRLTVTWINSNFGEPKTIPPGSYVMALFAPPPGHPPDGPQPGAYSLLDGGCSGHDFIFETSSDLANALRRVVSAPPSR